MAPRYFLLCILIGCQFGAIAQEGDTIDLKLTYGFYLGIPTLVADFCELNTSLSNSGLAQLAPGALGFSIGSTARSPLQNSYASIELSYLVAMDDNFGDELESRISMWQLSLTGHYDIIASQKWLVYPYFSFGLNYATLSVSQIYGDSFFENSLSNLNLPEIEQKKYDTFKPFVELGIGVERKIVIPRFNFYLGLSGGYHISPTTSWKLQGLKLYIDDPRLNTNAWNIEVIFRFEDNDVKPNHEWNLYRFFK